LSQEQTRSQDTIHQSVANLVETCKNTIKLSDKTTGLQFAVKTLNAMATDKFADRYKAYRQDRDMWFYATSDPYQQLIPMLMEKFGKQVTIVVPADPEIPGGRYKEGGFDAEALLSQNTSYLCNLTRDKLDASLERYNNDTLENLFKPTISENHILINQDDTNLPIKIMAQFFDQTQTTIGEFAVDQMARLKEHGAEVIIIYPQGLWAHETIDFATTLRAYRQAIYVAKKSRKIKAVVLVVPPHLVQKINKRIGARTLDRVKYTVVQPAFPVNIPKPDDITNIFMNWMDSNTRAEITQIQNSVPAVEPHIGVAFDKQRVVSVPGFPPSNSQSSQTRYVRRRGD